MNTQTHEDDCSFGQYLSAKRLENGISLEAVSHATKIGVDQLIFLEQEMLARFPAEVFVVGFIRAYADAVGADAAEALRRYRLSRTPCRQTRRRRRRSSRPQPRKWPRWVGALGILTALAAVSLYTYQAVATPGQTRLPSMAATAIPGEEAPQTVPPGAKGTEGQAVTTEAASPHMVLKVEAVEETRIKALIDNRKQVEYLLAPGEKAQMEASDRFNLLIGNAGGIRLTLNGKPVLVPGKSGQIVTLELPAK